VSDVDPPPLPRPPQGSAPLFKPACEFSRGLGARPRPRATASTCLRAAWTRCGGSPLQRSRRRSRRRTLQVGLLELRPCVSHTGGLCVLADSFGQSVFKESFVYVFRRFDDGAPAPDAGICRWASARRSRC